MSKITIREPVEIEERRMTPARRAKIIARDGGRCVRPDCPTPTDRLEVDHIVPLALGGSDAEWNAETVCHAHHLEKTRVDVAVIAKAKRRQRVHLGQKPPPTQKLRSRNTFKRRWQEEA